MHWIRSATRWCHWTNISQTLNGRKRCRNWFDGSVSSSYFYTNEYRLFERLCRKKIIAVSSDNHKIRRLCNNWQAYCCLMLHWKILLNWWFSLLQIIQTNNWHSNFTWPTFVHAFLLMIHLQQYACFRFHFFFSFHFAHTRWVLHQKRFVCHNSFDDHGLINRI